jgi:hypothetical protein
MSQSKLQAAKELLQEKNYTAARAILETLPGDPTAQRWLAKLNDIAPQQHRQVVKPIGTSMIPEPVIHIAQPAPRRKKRSPLVVLAIVIVVIAGGIWLFNRVQQQRRWRGSHRSGGHFRAILRISHTGHGQCIMQPMGKSPLK